MIAAGGTGGHIYPGLALAGALQRLAPEARVSFVGTRRGLEGRLIPEAGHVLHFVDMRADDAQGVLCVGQRQKIVEILARMRRPGDTNGASSR